VRRYIVATNLVWSRWASTQAVAAGDAAVNDCTPNCAAGRTHTVAAKLTLSAPQSHAGHVLFTTATPTLTGALPPGWSDGRTVEFHLPVAASTTGQAAVASAWATFFSGATPVAGKAAVLEQGAGAAADIRTFFSLFPANLTTKVDSVVLNGTTATVTYEFFAGTSPLSARPMAGTAVLINGKWLVSQQTWDAWLAQSDIHGSG